MKQQSGAKRPRGIETQSQLLEAAGRVFARMSYSEARLKDIVDESSISSGSLYFHFGNKDDIARAVLDAQQARMKAVLAPIITSDVSAFAKILALFDGLAALIASDVIVQAGITLSMQPVGGLEREFTAPYKSWIATAIELLEEGSRDGSVTLSIPAEEAAEILNETFVGAQVLAGFEDRWASLTTRIQRARPVISAILGSPTN